MLCRLCFVFCRNLEVYRFWEEIPCTATCNQLWDLGASVQLLISNVLLLFWRRYHCEIPSYVSVSRVMEGHVMSNLLFTYTSG